MSTPVVTGPLMCSLWCADNSAANLRSGFNLTTSRRSGYKNEQQSSKSFSPDSRQHWLAGGGAPGTENGGPVFPKPADSGYSNQIGRVGALVVALGVGAGIASMPAVAFAETTDSGGSAGSSRSSSDSSGSRSGGSSAGAESGSSLDSVGDASADTAETPDAGDTEDAADTEAADAEDDADAEVTEDDAGVADADQGSGVASGADDVSGAGGGSDSNEVVDKGPARSSGGARSPGRTGSSGSGSVDKVKSARVVAPTVQKRATSAPLAESPVSVSDSSASAGRSLVVVSTSPDEGVVGPAKVSRPVVEAWTPVAGPAKQLTRLWSLLSSWLVDGPASNGSPAVPAAAPLMWGAAAVARRELGGTTNARANANAVVSPSRLFGDGTAEHPDARSLFGNGFTWDATSCTGTTACTGGNAGSLGGNGGGGFNGGDGGSAGSLRR